LTILNQLAIKINIACHLDPNITNYQISLFRVFSSLATKDS